MDHSQSFFNMDYTYSGWSLYIIGMYSSTGSILSKGLPAISFLAPLFDII